MEVVSCVSCGGWLMDFRLWWFEIVRNVKFKGPCPRMHTKCGEPHSVGCATSQARRWHVNSEDKARIYKF